MAEVTEKLTKKQKKALEFRNKSKSKDSKDTEEADVKEDDDKKRKRDNEDTKDTKETTETAETSGAGEAGEAAEDGQVKKKRKTRRGNKGKGRSNGPRFLLFVGNLPYDITETELQSHFSACKPDRIRIRTEKGIAFLEFDGAGGDIQHKMEVALRMHRSTLRDRKINVELTVGGGGNSLNRLEKIKEKNNKLDDERKETIRKKKKEDDEKKKKAVTIDLKDIHPARAAKLLQK